jgi:hypothetical protein
LGRRCRPAEHRLRRARPRPFTSRLGEVQRRSRRRDARNADPGLSTEHFDNTFRDRLRGRDGVGAWNQAGTLVTSDATFGYPLASAAIGTGAAGPYLYFNDWALGTVRRFDGTVFTTPGGVPAAFSMTLSPTSNRLVIIDWTLHHRVKFSDAGTPETFTANNFVDLHPNDGSGLVGLATWRDLVFAFKQNKFFVFYGESTDSSGNPIFNYRTVDTGVGMAAFESTKQAAAAPDALYFGNDEGIWRTTGGPPEKVSQALDPIFRNEFPATFTAFSSWSSLVTSHGGKVAELKYWNGKIIAFLAVGGATAVTAVYTIATGDWSLWSGIGGYNAPAKIGGIPTLVYNSSTAYLYTLELRKRVDHRRRHGDHLTLSLRLLRPRHPEIKTIREWRLEGTGTPTLRTSFDMGALEAGAAVALGVQRRRSTRTAAASRSTDVGTRGRSARAPPGRSTTSSPTSARSDCPESAHDTPAPQGRRSDHAVQPRPDRASSSGQRGDHIAIRASRRRQDDGPLDGSYRLAALRRERDLAHDVRQPLRSDRDDLRRRRRCDHVQPAEHERARAGRRRHGSGRGGRDRAHARAKGRRGDTPAVGRRARGPRAPGAAEGRQRRRHGRCSTSSAGGNNVQNVGPRHRQHR